jgi:tetratricopeptide (TPR) repeat protein
MSVGLPAQQSLPAFKDGFQSGNSSNLEELLDSLEHGGDASHLTAEEKQSSKFSLSPEEQSAIFEKGIKLLQSKNYSSALDIFDSCLEAQPDNPYLLFYRAQALYSMQRYQDAVDDLRRCTEEHPLFSDDYNRAAANFYMQIFTRLLQQETDSDAEEGSEVRDTALQNYYKAIGTSSKAALLVLRGMAAFYSGQLELAIQDFSQAIAADSKCFQAYFMRGSCCQRQRDYGPALIDFFSCLELDPAAPRVFFNIGLCYCRLGQPLKGVEFFTRSIMALPEDPSAYNNRGAAFRDLNDPSKAVADFSVAIKLDPSYPNAWANRAC